MPINFADRLCAAVTEKNSRAVVGIDPRIELLPLSVSSGAAAERCLKFATGVIDAAGPYVCAVKPQVAFFEALGSAGMKAYAETLAYARDKGLIIIGDVKRGDIGSTVAAYAQAHLAPGSDFEVDAITANAYLGHDGMEPFLDQCSANGKGIFVLLRTSNPTAGQIQDVGGDDCVWKKLSRLADEWGRDLVGEKGYSSVGVVVGATYPKEALEVRELAPKAVFLMPGVGAQGANPADAAGSFDDDGLGAIVPSSRGIIFAFRNKDGTEADDWQDAVAGAAMKMRDQLNFSLGKED